MPPLQPISSLGKSDPMQAIHDDTIAPIDKYLILRHLQSRNPRRFYDLLMTQMEVMLPYLYTPTVGEACMHYHTLNIPTYGLYIRATDKGNILSKLRNFPIQNISVVVVTDGERILGLGDLGAGGMGISEGKSLLYSACAGVHPSQVLPVCLDVGTNNSALLRDPLYAGMRQRRVTGEAYEEFVQEFIDALKAWRPHVCLQFEDFSNHIAFHLLYKFRRQICCFNDDIQGTACICLAGLLSALRATNSSLATQRVLFLGAGEAGTGIAELIAIALEQRHGMTRVQGRQHCFFVDSKGLVCSSRTDLQPHKRPFAWDVSPCSDLLEVIEEIQPTVLIGVSTLRGAFTPQILKRMSEINKRPIIFPLSNPTSKSECTYQEAFDATDGRVLFASGSPFAPIQRNGRVYTPAQANNAYCFPAIGHAAVLCRAKEIFDVAFLLAAETLAELTTRDELEAGLLFPRFSEIQNVSAKVMAAIADDMCQRGTGTLPEDFESSVAGKLHAATTAVGSGGRHATWEVYARQHMLRAVNYNSKL